MKKTIKNIAYHHAEIVDDFSSLYRDTMRKKYYDKDIYEIYVTAEVIENYIIDKTAVILTEVIVYSEEEKEKFITEFDTSTVKRKMILHNMTSDMLEKMSEYYADILRISIFENKIFL